MRIGQAFAPDRRPLTFAWTSVAALLAIGILLTVRSEVSFRRQAVEQAEVQADIVAASLGAALAFDDRNAVREYVGGLRVNRRVAAAGVYDAAGRAVVTFHRGAARGPPPQVISGAAATRYSYLTVTRPVMEQGQQLGWIYLELAPDSWRRVLGRHAALALLTLLAFLLLGALTTTAGRLDARARELASANIRLRQEIAGRAKAEEALRQSQKMEALGQLTGGIAHDFNNLLQVIHGAFELIQRRPGDPRVATWADNGLSAADRGASLTRQLLTFSRSQKLELQAFVIADLIGEMRELLERTLGGSIELRLELDDSQAPVRSDRTQLELAVLNLAINARDAMPEGGRLTISTRVVSAPPGHPVLAPGEYLELRVADTGFGMPAEVVERAFEPFFTTKGVGKGTGLGLSQVYGVASQAGGEARIESSPGAGTAVILLLRKSAAPVEAEAAEPPTPAGEAGSASARAASVLVVDDEPQVRALTCDALELLGYEVSHAESATEALRMISEARPDLLLIDYAMPGMNGAECAQHARARWPELRVLFASGHADTSAVERAVGGGARILHKPFDVDGLAAAVAAALPHPAASAGSPQG